MTPASSVPRTRTFTRTIRCRFEEATALLSDPARYGEWAAGLAQSPPRPAGPGRWQVQQPQGTAELRFAPANALGVFDHWVLPAGAAERDAVHVPLRVIRLGDAVCEVQLTLIAPPGTDAAAFDADGQAITRDLATLRDRLERAG